MNGRFKIKIIFFFYSVLVILFIFQPETFCQQISESSRLFIVEKGINHMEVELEEGRDFTIRLMGKGWYLNRFDSNSIDFKARFPEEEFTDFLFTSLTEGSSYLFFSYLEKDVYILLKIKGKEVIDQSSEEIVEKVQVYEEAVESVESPEEPVKTTPASEDVTENEQVSEDSLKKSSPKEDEKNSLEQGKKGEQTLQKKKLEGVEEGDIYYINEENRIVKIPLKDEMNFYRKGIKAFHKGEWKKALENFSTYLEECQECEKSIEVHYHMADLYIHLEEPEMALNHLDKVIDSGSPEYKRKALIQKGKILYKKQNLAEAELIFEQASISGEETYELLLMRGDIYYRLGHYEKALHVYLKIISMNKGDEEIIFRVARMFDTPGKYRNLEKAYKYYRMIMENYPRSEYCKYAEKRIKFLEKNFFYYQ